MTQQQILPKFIFWSRWLQAPLYIGLILVLGIYVYEFGAGLIRLVTHINTSNETAIMLQVLDLIDVVMIANLLIMVIIGGYQTFVSSLGLNGDPNQPEWLGEVNAGTMKVKLALALVSISSIHLLRTFMEPAVQQPMTVMWQVVIHITLLVSAITIAFTNKLTH